MKNQFIVVGLTDGNLPCIFTGETFDSYARHDSYTLQRAKKWTTREGAERWIARSKAQGSDWQMFAWPVVPEVSLAASMLGKMGEGKAKTISPEESQARRERLAVSRAKRWQK